MLRDVFYFGNKPNAHPREKQARNLAEARKQATTEHFWIINEYCDYRNFDWDFDFEFLPDEDVWAYEHDNIWPSQHQKDSGTWLCNADNKLPLTIYRADVQPVLRHNEKNDRWILHDLIDETKFDFSWHPDPTDPPFIYHWGCKFFPVEVKNVIEYSVPGAINIKYMTDEVALEPKWDRWVITDDIDKNKFDFSWRPDPREPAFIYHWGCKFFPVEVKSVLEYHTEGSSIIKYMTDEVALEPKWDRWVIADDIDKNEFDFSWRPDPREPAFIYAWGNQWTKAEDKISATYTVEGATQYKYIDEYRLTRKQFKDNWIVPSYIDASTFDYSWEPKPNEPDFIYQFPDQWSKAGGPRYVVNNATDVKYIDYPVAKALSNMTNWSIPDGVDVSEFDFSWHPGIEDRPYKYQFGTQWQKIGGPIYYSEGANEYSHVKYVDEVKAKALPNMKNWIMPEHNIMASWFTPDSIDTSEFDFSWHPDIEDIPYIYKFGTQWQKTGGPVYYADGVNENSAVKYIDATRAKALPTKDNWVIHQAVVEDQLSWHPDETEKPYIYTWGNKYVPAEVEPTLEYHVPGATERKYVGIVDVKPQLNRWETLIPVDKSSFDFSWRPDPREPAYIYVWGNKYNDAVREPTITYTCPGATEFKYMDDVVATTLPDMNKWLVVIPVDNFDYSWRPDPKSPPYVYVFGNKWNDATVEPTVEYWTYGASERKYVKSIVAITKPELKNWHVSNVDDYNTFDFSWRPNPHSPPQIYQWADNGPRYTVPGATEVVLMERTETTITTNRNTVNRYKLKTTLEDLIAEHPDEVFWVINPDLNYDKFDFNWRPNSENFRHINVFGNEYSKNTQTYYVNGPLYTMGHREFNYVEEQTVEIDSNLSMFFVDKNNNESQQRFEELKQRYPKIQKTRYLNSWVDTINRCLNKSETEVCWILNSELDYTNFTFDYYPSPWQMKMVHIFGTQWSHWGTTFMVNKETFIEDTKHIKIIEHLSNLNFVKTKRAVASNCLYDVYLIDYGNDTTDNITSLLENKTKKNVEVIKYDNDYLTTLKNMLYELGIKKEHYVWVCSSICDYTNFDFTYICDPFSLEQLHVFPSNLQKFGDTFFINVNKLRMLIEELDNLEKIEKINFNQHQRVKRLPAPNFITESDTHVSITNTDFNWPYATFVTEDNKEIKVVDNEPISLWSKESKNILITTTGGTRIIVPKEAKEYVKKELYDYPYISKADKLIQSKPLDIVFLSNGEVGADENYEHLLNVTKGLPNRVVRVDGVNGRVQAYHAAATASETPWMFTVFAKLRINSKFDFTWQPDRLQIPKHYIFYASNPVNGLVYGHQAMIAYHKQITLSNMGKGLDFTLDNEHEVVEINSGVARYNTDEFSTWRTSFREVIKLKLDDSPDSKQRLKIWSTVGEGDYAQYSIDGAKHAVEYVEQVNGELGKLRLSYDWPWLKKYFNAKYN